MEDPPWVSPLLVGISHRHVWFPDGQNMPKWPPNFDRRSFRKRVPSEISKRPSGGSWQWPPMMESPDDGIPWVAKWVAKIIPGLGNSGTLCTPVTLMNGVVKNMKVENRVESGAEICNWSKTAVSSSWPSKNGFALNCIILVLVAQKNVL